MIARLGDKVQTAENPRNQIVLRNQCDSSGTKSDRLSTWFCTANDCEYTWESSISPKTSVPIPSPNLAPMFSNGNAALNSWRKVPIKLMPLKRFLSMEAGLNPSLMLALLLSKLKLGCP